MSYTITLTDGAIYATIADGTINTSANPAVTLVGKNYAGYGAFLNTNFMRMLENSSNNTAPPAPIEGQLWWNNTASAGQLSVYMGSAWKSLSALVVSSTTPSAAVYSTTGDLWYDTVNQQVNIWTGSAWLLVGPQFSAGTGITGAFANVITDSISVTHKVIELVVNNNVVGIISEDTVFTPQTTIPGFANVNPGLQLANVSNGVGGASVPSYWGQGNTGLNVAGNITARNIFNTTGNISGNIGNSTSYFNTVFANTFSGTSTTALYADVAERFSADAAYEPGIVVELGGSAEITRSTTELSDSVFGVISTRAAYLMNSGAGSDLTHPPVAMTGRVPVQCTGVIHKGDRLVSAGNGFARSAQPGEATAFNTIGRALVDKLDSGVCTVEAIVTIK
jgi:hypothetical protein